MRSFIAFLKLTGFLLSSFFTFVFQWPISKIGKGQFVYWWPRIFHGLYGRLIGLRVVTEGTIERGAHVVYMGNHLSYLDIPAVGSLLNGAFVAKKDVASWPFFGAMGNLQRTVYISRNPADAQTETATLLERLDQAAPLIIFPEGTSSDGTKILPFKSSFFQIFLNKNIKIQPFTISLISVDKKSADSSTIRDMYAWYGDMALGPHLWSFLKSKGAIIKLKFQEPILSIGYNDRKQLCNDVYSGVVKGLDLSSLSAYGATPDPSSPTPQQHGNAGAPHANHTR